jgi:hypothetical protein
VVYCFAHLHFSVGRNSDALNRLKPISRKDADPYRICVFSFLIIDLPAKR